MHRLTRFAVGLAATCWFAAAISSASARVLDAEAFLGSPLSVGRITVLTGEQSFTPLTDDRFVVKEKNGRALYTAVEAAPFRRLVRDVLQIGGQQRVNVYFLFRGDEPLELTVYSPEPQQITVRPRADARTGERLLEAWWREYNRQPLAWGADSEFPSIVEDYLRTMLAHRMGLTPTKQRKAQLLPDLDADLNSAIRLLDDTDALRRQALRDLLRNNPADQAKDQPLPAAVQLPLTEFAELAEKPEIEPMAMHVPAESIYIRFGAFANHLWMHDFMDQYGGDLRNMITLRAIKNQGDKRFQQQIALRESALARVVGPTVIADVALVGNDMMMRDGAGMGIIFQARNNQLLGDDFRDQRAEVLKEDKTAKEVKVRIGKHEVSYLSNASGTIRSYYAVDGDFHLFTPSRRLVERFFEAGAGKNALGASLEFQHARAVLPVSRDYTIFAYISQQFQLNQTRPEFRIETRRRMQSVAEMDLLQLARFAAQAEGRSAESVAELVDGGYLPRQFGRRIDGSQLEFAEGVLRDSKRGLRGSFIPISDREIDRVTAAEAAAYEEYSKQITAEWSHKAPIAVGIRRGKAGDGKLERLSVEVRVAPIADVRAHPLAKYLGAPSQQRVRPIAGDLASLEVVTSGGFLGMPQSEPHHVFGGVRDFALPAVIRDGKVEFDLARLEMVRAYLGVWPQPGLLANLGFLPPTTDAQGYAPMRGLPLWQRLMGEFRVVAFRRDVLEEVTPRIEIVDAERPAQLWLNLADLGRSDVAEGITALGYMREVNASRGGAQFMNMLADQLHVPIDECRDVAERLLDAEIVCPLGGKYEVVEVPGGLRLWSSTKLVDQGNAFNVKNVPKDYQFPLLQWFHGGRAEVGLVNETLAANIEIDMRPVPQPDWQIELPSLPSLPSLPGFSFKKSNGDSKAKPIPKESQDEELPPPKPNGEK